MSTLRKLKETLKGAHTCKYKECVLHVPNPEQIVRRKLAEGAPRRKLWRQMGDSRGLGKTPDGSSMLTGKLEGTVWEGKHWGRLETKPSEGEGEFKGKGLFPLEKKI